MRGKFQTKQYGVFPMYRRIDKRKLGTRAIIKTIEQHCVTTAVEYINKNFYLNDNG